MSAAFAGAGGIAVLAFYVLRSDGPPGAHVDDAPLPIRKTDDFSTRGERKTAAVTVTARPPFNEPASGGPPKTQSSPAWTPDLLRNLGGFAIPPPSGMESIDNAFAAEPVDPAWAPGREADILEEISQTTGLQVITIQVKCRTSACRVQMSQTVPVPERAGEFAPDPIYFGLFDRLGYLGSARYPMAVTFKAYGTATWVVYLARANASEVAEERIRDRLSQQSRGR
jgi:hypothetical protein